MRAKRRAPKVLHVTGLYQIGGVEQLFRSYLGYSSKSGSLEHHVHVMRHRIHPYIRDQLVEPKVVDP